MKRDESGKATLMSTEEYLESLPEHHRNTFDYSESVYLGNDKPITFLCPVHGEQTYHKAGKHKISPCGCKECGKEEASRAKKEKGLRNFFRRSKELYGDKYDYSLVIYEKSALPVTIVCPHHGKFRQSPNNHTSGNSVGCPVCARSHIKESLKLKPDEMLKRCREKFKDRFEYMFDLYENSKSFIKIRCPAHGWFDSKLSNHLESEFGCPDCYHKSEKSSWNAISKETNVDVLKDLYKGKYHFFTEDIGKSNDYVRYYCPKHHHFHKTQLRHLKDGFACDKCGDEVMAEKLTGFYTVKRIERDKEFYQKDYNTLYIMKLLNGVYKIGIAKHPKTRLCSVRTQSEIKGAELVSVFEGSTYDCFYLEKYFHKYFRDKRFKFDHAWKGHTEVFELTDKELSDVLVTARFELKEDFK